MLMLIVAEMRLQMEGKGGRGGRDIEVYTLGVWILSVLVGERVEVNGAEKWRHRKGEETGKGKDGKEWALLLPSR